MIGLPHKTKQFFFVLIKLSIVLAAFYFIYNKLTHNNTLKFSVFTDFTLNSHFLSFKTVILALVLSGLNWFFEILKWKNLIHPVKQISFTEAAQQSLGSLTASLFTPNRIGEYGAKALFFASGKRKKVMFTNLIANMLQMALTLIFGTIGLYFFCKTYQPEIIFYSFARYAALLAMATLILITWITIKNRKLIKNPLIEKPVTFLKQFSKRQLSISFLFALFRYVIFSFQFYFLLRLFSTGLNYLQAMSIISSMYLLASAIPSIFIFDMVVKGSIAVYLFSFAGINELAILSIVTLMWALNFALPSVLGSYYVLNFKLPKNRATT